MGQFSGKHISQTIMLILSNYRDAYMEGIKYANLIDIGPVVIEIQGVENNELAVPVNNILVCHTAFLAATHDRVSWCIPMGCCTTFHWEVIVHQGSCNILGELWLWYITFKPQKLPLIWGVKVLHMALVIKCVVCKSLSKEARVMMCSSSYLFHRRMHFSAHKSTARLSYKRWVDAHLVKVWKQGNVPKEYRHHIIAIFNYCWKVLCF